MLIRQFKPQSGCIFRDTVGTEESLHNHNRTAQLRNEPWDMAVEFIDASVPRTRLTMHSVCTWMWLQITGQLVSFRTRMHLFLLRSTSSGFGFHCFDRRVLVLLAGNTPLGVIIFWPLLFRNPRAWRLNGVLVFGHSSKSATVAPNL